MSSLPVFSEVRVAQSFVFCVVFYKSLVVLLSFSFCHCILHYLFFFNVLLLVTPLMSSSLYCLSFDWLLLNIELVSSNLYCLSFELMLLNTTLVSSNLYCLSFDLMLLNTTLVSSNLYCLSFDLRLPVTPFGIIKLVLSMSIDLRLLVITRWYHQTCTVSDHWFTASGYNPLVSSNLYCLCPLIYGF